MARTSTFPLHDRALDGQLKPLLRKWRKAGLSYQEITFRLRSEHEVAVNASTVMRWCNELGITDRAAS